MTPPAESACRPAITLSHLTVTKGEQIICKVTNAAIARGNTVGITGPNGSGKSTLLRVLAGLETDFEGNVHIDIPLADRVFVHQSPYLFSGTVLENVEYGLKARSVSKPVRRSRAELWLKRFGIGHLASRSARSLSGGEGRRTALARACVLEPELLLLDEPLADLDAAGAELVAQSLKELSGSTILLSSPTPLPQKLTESTINLTGTSSHKRISE
ncbi:MAG: ABC-type nitrate/sulfonate/bicarbonate transport system ATPase subunit [Planctomycetaceae bacterium]|jgi:ABC-type nitrate/sulfonate/bicarbonate transport system ATPase subunit